MKKIVISILISLVGLAGLSAENLKVKIGGPERTYNQMRIINETDDSYFDCKVYSLKEKNGKLVAKDELGIFHLKEKYDTDSCVMSLKKNQYVGIAVPEDLGKVSYSIVYRDMPFFDVVEVYLKNDESDVDQDEILGLEF